MTFAGKMTIPAGKMTFPAGKSPNSFGMKTFSQNCSSRREEAPNSIYFVKFEPRYLGCYEVMKKALNNLRFFRGRGRGRVDIVMTAHLAADGLQLLGFRRVLAQQTHHGVNRAAGVGVRVVGGGLQLGRLVLHLHVQVFLLGGQDADVGDFALQPRNVRRRVEIFRRERLLIVGVLHVRDDLVDDPDFFSDGVHGFSDFVNFGLFRLRPENYQQAKKAATTALSKTEHFLPPDSEGKAEILKAQSRN